MSIKIQQQDLMQEVNDLKKSEFGKIICQGLAELVKVKPQFPIDYLSKWLFNVDNDKKNHQIYNESFKKKEQYKANIQEQEKQKQIEAEQLIQNQKKQEQQDQDFQDQIINHKYHREFMEYQFPQKLKEKYDLSGVYAGQVLTFGEDKLIKYFGFSENQNFMDQNVLPKDQGVTYSLLKEIQEDVEEGEKKVKQNFIYVPSVIQEPRIYFFQIPRLGSYLAVKLSFNSYLNENKFNDSIQSKISQLSAKTELKQAIEEREQSYKKEISECEPDLVDEITQAYNQQKEQDIKTLEAEITLPSEKQEYIVGMDTCGKDREISQQDIDEIIKNIQFYGQQWETKELELWNTDIDNYLKYQEKINKETQQIIDRFSESEEIYLKQNIQNLDKWSIYERIYEYEQNALRLEKVKKQLKSQEVLEWFQILAQYQVVQFPEFIKVILIFMGYKNEDLLIKNSDKFDWIKYRSLFSNDEFIQKIVNYNHRGAKSEKSTLKIQYFQKQIENFNDQDINNYNLSLGRLYRWFQLTCKCRISDVQARRELKEESKQNRIKAEQAQKEWELQKEQFVQKGLESLTEEDKPTFDKVACEQEYVSLYPEITIPIEIQTDDDGDYE